MITKLVVISITAVQGCSCSQTFEEGLVVKTSNCECGRETSVN